MQLFCYQKVSLAYTLFSQQYVTALHGYKSVLPLKRMEFLIKMQLTYTKNYCNDMNLFLYQNCPTASLWNSHSK